jgi:hypothetical protein
MAEGLLRELACESFDVFSAGTVATRVHPLAGGRTGLKTGHERHDCHRGDDAYRGAEELSSWLPPAGRLVRAASQRSPTP